MGLGACWCMWRTGVVVRDLFVGGEVRGLLLGGCNVMVSRVRQVDRECSRIAEVNPEQLVGVADRAVLMSRGNGTIVAACIAMAG